LTTKVVNAGKSSTGNVFADGVISVVTAEDEQSIYRDEYHIGGTATAKVSLTRDTVTVEQNQLGQVELLKENKGQLIDISRVDSIGRYQSFDWSFSDGQTAVGFTKWQYVGVEVLGTKIPYAAVSNLRFVQVARVEGTDDPNVVKVVLLFKATYEAKDINQLPEGVPASGELDLEVEYYQKAIVAPQPAEELTYTTKMTFDPDASGMYGIFEVFRSDGKTFSYTNKMASCGKISGGIYHVINTDHTCDFSDREDSRPEMNETGVSKDGYFSWVKSSHIWRFNVESFLTEANGHVGPVSEILFWSKNYTFIDPETGWSYTWEFEKSTNVVENTIKYLEDAPKEVELNDGTGRKGIYIGSYVLSIVNLLNKTEKVNESTSVSHLYCPENLYQGK